MLDEKGQLAHKEIYCLWYMLAVEQYKQLNWTQYKETKEKY